MAIRWDDFPHDEIRLKIYVRLRQNSLGRSAEDSLRNLLQRRLASLDSEDHRRFIELGAQSLVEHLRCTRDIYREFVEEQNCRPILEAHWVVLRCAVFPTAIEALQKQVINYAKLTRIPGRDLSVLFGIVTRTCRSEGGGPFGVLCPPDLQDDTPATDDELESFGNLINEDNLLWFRDIRDDGAVGRPFGGGPFSTDDAVTIHNSFGVCAIRQMTLPEWLDLRNKWWHVCTPWTDGLCNLFLSVQEELMSQWRALPPDSLVHKLGLRERTSHFEKIIVPPDSGHPSRFEAIVNSGEVNSTPEVAAIVKSAMREQREAFFRPLLENLGWSIHDWAKNSNVDFHTANDYIKGNTSPYPSTRKKLADSLRINAKEMPI